MIPTEHAEQVAFVRWFKANYPDVWIFAIPNGGWRNKATAQRLKQEGASPGAPDLMIPEWRAFIEMKRSKGGRVSPEQRERLDYLTRCGYQTAVCAGFVEAVAFVQGCKKNPDTRPG